MRQGVMMAVIVCVLVAFSSGAQEAAPRTSATCPMAGTAACPLMPGGAQCPAAASGCVMLFNGKDLTGLMGFIPDSKVDPATVWSVKDGVIHCAGNPAGYLRTTEKYANYRLCFQWRWAGESGGNSGCLMHIQDKDEVWPKSIESQLQSEQAGDFWVIGGADFKEHTNKDDRRVPKRQPHNEKPIGEWNQMMVLCDGDTIQVAVNGVLQNVATDVTLEEGYIGWQSEGTPIEFRCICLTPLDKLTPEQRKDWMKCPAMAAAQAQDTKDTK